MSIADPVPLSFESFTLDPAARTLVDATGESIPLRRSEFELLLAFVTNPGRALSRDYCDGSGRLWASVQKAWPRLI